MKRGLFKSYGQDKCFYCGEPFTGPDDATEEHLVPLSRGGEDRRYNIVLAHSRCNGIRNNILALDELAKLQSEGKFKRRKWEGKRFEYVLKVQREIEDRYLLYNK